MEQTTVSSRIPEHLKASLEEAANTQGVFQSEIIRRALRYYVQENPDGLQALDEAYASPIGTARELQEDERE